MSCFRGGQPFWGEEQLQDISISNGHHILNTEVYVRKHSVLRLNGY
jgi:hypothetical protein